nr:beta-defensin 112 isoform X4 [Bubalus bubalis]
MKILLFFSISFFFDVFILPVDSRSVGNTLSPPKVTCLRKLEKLHSETHNSSTIFENAQYGTEEKQKARSELEPKYRFERCQDVKGICKPFCDDTEYDYGYCIKWRNQCCI